MYNRNPVTWLDEVGKRNKTKSSGTVKSSKPKKSKKEGEAKSS